VPTKARATSTRRLRLPRDWPKIRRYILDREGRICHVCRQPGADQVDHVVAGDNHHETNLAAIHSWPCHARKSSSESAAARPKRWRPPVRSYTGGPETPPATPVQVAA
jgi:5-methylcytosine-specific restriction endonuclease McrA